MNTSVSTAIVTQNATESTKDSTAYPFRCASQSAHTADKSAGSSVPASNIRRAVNGRTPSSSPSSSKPNAQRRGLPERGVFRVSSTSRRTECLRLPLAMHGHDAPLYGHTQGESP